MLLAGEEEEVEETEEEEEGAVHQQGHFLELFEGLVGGVGGWVG